MSTVTRYDYIVDSAKKPARSWSNKEVAQFHYFNPNGLIAQKRKNDELIRDMVNNGLVASGWHMAYGCMSDLRERSLIDLAMSDKRISSIDIHVAVKMLSDEIKSTTIKIAEVMDSQEVAA